MLPAVSAKSHDSFNEALQHHYFEYHVLFRARTLPRDQEVWHTFCQLGVPCVPAIIEIAKCAGIGCLTGADARFRSKFRSKFHVARMRTELAVGAGRPRSTYWTGVLHVQTFCHGVRFHPGTSGI